jgi:hypothetical protein
MTRNTTKGAIDVGCQDRGTKGREEVRVTIMSTFRIAYMRQTYTLEIQCECSNGVELRRRLCVSGK